MGARPKASPPARAGRRPAGRPRQYDDAAERRLVLDAAYVALRDHGSDFTVAHILTAAGVSTRSFYRHFESKDALLQAMYLRDATWAAERLAKRLAEARAPVQAVEWWIDEIFSFTRVAKRAERVAVLGTIPLAQAADADSANVAGRARAQLIGSLLDAIRAGQDSGTFVGGDPFTLADLVAATAMHAAGLTAADRGISPQDEVATVAFCLRALTPRPNAS